MTAEELNMNAIEVAEFLDRINQPVYAEYVRRLNVAYKTQCIQANNYKKALEALENASK